MSEEEFRVLLPLLAAYPDAYPYETVVACHAAEAEDEMTLARYRRRLVEARDEVLSPVRQVCATLNKRRELRALNMRVLCAEGAGYCLAPFVTRPQGLTRPGAQAAGAAQKRR